MNTACADATTPPEWVRLTELTNWVDRIYGVGGEHIVRELILAVRSRREIRHRVLPERDSTRSLPLPAGLDHTMRGGGGWYVIVADWELAEADWQTCTIGGWKKADGTRERLAIEVPWENVADFVAMRLDRWKKTDRPRAKPPFDAREAKALLAAKKVAGVWVTAPTEEESRKFLLSNFRGVPNEPHRKIRREVWPDIRRGRRPQRVGELTHKNC